MLTPAERQRLRNAGRDAYFKAHGKDEWLVQAANEAKGANARAKELTAWKRNMCNSKFSQLSRQEQVAMFPEFAAYHADEDAREAVASAAASASSAPAALPEPAEPAGAFPSSTGRTAKLSHVAGRKASGPKAFSWKAGSARSRGLIFEKVSLPNIGVGVT